MTLGNVTFLLVSAFFLICGIWLGFKEIQLFGYILTAIAIALIINRIVKIKKYGK